MLKARINDFIQSSDHVPPTLNHKKQLLGKENNKALNLQGIHSYKSR